MQNYTREAFLWKRSPTYYYWCKTEHFRWNLFLWSSTRSTQVVRMQFDSLLSLARSASEKVSIMFFWENSILYFSSRKFDYPKLISAAWGISAMCFWHYFLLSLESLFSKESKTIVKYNAGCLERTKKFWAKYFQNSLTHQAKLCSHNYPSCILSRRKKNWNNYDNKWSRAQQKKLSKILICVLLMGFLYLSSPVYFPISVSA